jgi:membrane protease YdiL (CAAX protease family)
MGESRWADAFILIVMALLALWINSQFGQLAGRSNEAFVASAYFGMTTLALIVMVGAQSNLAFFKFIGIDKPLNKLLPFVIFGGIVGFLITTQGKLVLARVLQSPGAIDPTLGFAFVIALAPFVEEYLFRGVLFPSFEKFFTDKGRGTLISFAFAALLSSGLFSIWHLVASGGNESVLFGEVVFGVLMCVLVRVSGSLGTSIAAHLVRNLMTFAGG